MKHILLTILLFFVSHFSFAIVGPVDLRCVSVDENGDINVTWIQPSDPSGEFNSYILTYENMSSGAIASVTINTINTTTYTLPAIGNANRYKISIRLLYNDAVTGAAGETISNSLVSMSTNLNVVSDTLADFGWTQINDTVLSTHDTTYSIWKRVKNGLWNQIDISSFGNENYQDSFKVCQDTFSYRVGVQDQSGCISYSSLAEGVFIDNTAPDAPVIDSITVDPITNQVSIGWQPSKALDTDGYYILLWDDIAGYLIIDTIIGSNNTFYTNTTSNATNNAYQYTVAAFDNCYKGPLLSPNVSPGKSVHRTIFLSLTYDACEEETSLSWEKYRGWDTVGVYKIFVKEGNSPFKEIGEVSSADSTFIHSGASPFVSHTYVIQGNDANTGYISLSNIDSVGASSQLVPDTLYLYNATVDAENSVDVSIYMEQLGNVHHYKLYRGVDRDGPYVEIENKTVNGLNLTLSDKAAPSSEGPCWYYVTAHDSCDRLLKTSNKASTIFLQGSFDEGNMVNRLNWTPYFGWGHGGARVEAYQVTRGVFPMPVVDSLGNSGDTLLYYQDNITENIQQGSKFCYHILAYETGDGFHQFKSVSKSNEICMSADVIMYIPNAFVPDGINKVFKPVLAFVNNLTFKMRIFDRWGDVVFETSNIDEGWDGMKNGQVMKSGAYIYQIEFTNQYNDRVERKGVFYLVR